MSEEPLAGKIYTHHKGGRYLVIHVVDDSTNARVGNTGVVYVSLTKGVIKYRDLSEFTEMVVWPDGKTRPRFIPE